MLESRSFLKINPPKSKMNPKVDEYLRGETRWREEQEILRSIALDCGLSEEVKWGHPCYAFEKKNVVIISGLKDYCALSFFNGALLKDPKGILVRPGENTRAGRLVRFTSASEITRLKADLKSYILEAIELEKAGVKVDMTEGAELEMPEELEDQLDKSPVLREAFESLTPGRQRAYILHIAAAKQSKTREARIEKVKPRILDGKGLNDCTCGHSKRMPACDGSHRFL
jgi:uncharacterized protein YdeI (YjbR/CyaY-like superfamily)